MVLLAILSRKLCKRKSQCLLAAQLIIMAPLVILLAILSEIMLKLQIIKSQGGAIYSAYNTKIGDITGDFVGNYASGAAAGRRRYFRILWYHR